MVVRGSIARVCCLWTKEHLNTKPTHTHAQGSPHPPAAVALVIDSPGGSATVSNLIGSYIDDKASTTKIPVLSFATDVAASGGYW